MENSITMETSLHINPLVLHEVYVTRKAIYVVWS